MIYKFAVIADIHWGAMNSATTFQNLEIFLEFIRQMKDNLDFVVIAGDYFDYRLQLNSKTALLSIEWFDRLIKTCKENGVKKVRMFKGTREHDNEQLEAFRPRYETEDGFFKLYNTTTKEELFDNLTCVFCPDENMNLTEYHETYWNQFIPHADIGFFHGNFDAILPEIEFNRIQEHNLPTMIYEYNKFARLIKGPLISGHWHIATQHRSLYYIGSYDRWKFGEEEDKGFIYGEYNTEDTSYYIHQVNNPLAREYRTLMYSSDGISSPEDFGDISEEIRKIIKDNHNIRIRVTYVLVAENPEAIVNFNNFQKIFSTNPQVKIVFKDLVKKESKKERSKEVAFEASKYDYIFNSDYKMIPEILHKFILESKTVDIPIEVIQKYVDKYLSGV